MEEYLSPDEIRSLISRCESDRQKLILYLIYNYGLTPDELIEIKASQFMLKQDLIMFNLYRKFSGKTRTLKLQADTYRLFYRALQKLQAGDPLLHREKAQPVSEAILQKDIFDLAILLNRKITIEQLFESHLYWMFRRGVNFAQAVEEYGITLSGRPFEIWQDAQKAGKYWPNLLD